MNTDKYEIVDSASACADILGFDEITIAVRKDKATGEYSLCVLEEESVCTAFELSDALMENDLSFAYPEIEDNLGATFATDEDAVDAMNTVVDALAMC